MRPPGGVPPSAPPRGALVVLALAALVLGACVSARASNDEATIAIHYSRFEPDVIEAKAGVPITITLRNDDPIEHEWIVGDALTHAAHRTGTEPYHDEVPTEVTIPALSSRTTTVVFGEAGEYLYICHLPVHEAYGMVGMVRVVEG
jgi:uncharacterized cupredoxin-like copper-binding protein